MDDVDRDRDIRYYRVFGVYKAQCIYIYICTVVLFLLLLTLYEPTGGACCTGNIVWDWYILVAVIPLVLPPPFLYTHIYIYIQI